MALIGCCRKSGFQKCPHLVIDFDIGSAVMDLLTYRAYDSWQGFGNVSEVIFSQNFLGTFIGRKCTSQLDSPIISSLAIKSGAVKEILTGTKLDLARAKGKRRQY